MTKTVAVETDLPGRGFVLKRQSAKVGILYTPHHKQVLLWEGVPIAVYMDGTVYKHSSVTAAKQGAITRYYPNAAEVTHSTRDFNFVLGQVLSQAGLSLVRAQESEA